jgi:hypothetical protein
VRVVSVEILQIKAVECSKTNHLAGNDISLTSYVGMLFLIESGHFQEFQTKFISEENILWKNYEKNVTTTDFQKYTYKLYLKNLLPTLSIP